ncbi:MAG: CopG family transcriptional regulator [Candidatus Saccharibacteria bacterium]|nr:CopG family transcriptional regulator [Candidatus Saccharibacteria bacterium]
MTKLTPKDTKEKLEKQTVYLPKEFRRYVRMQAARQQMTISDYFIQKIEEDLQDLEDIKAIEEAKNSKEDYYSLEEFTRLLKQDGIL